jgi:hypothetical protein
MAWDSGGTGQGWHVSADWLTAHGVGVDEVYEDAVVERILLLERLTGQREPMEHGS